MRSLLAWSLALLAGAVLASFGFLRVAAGGADLIAALLVGVGLLTASASASRFHVAREEVEWRPPLARSGGEHPRWLRG
jgi:hypothetical protein